MPQLKRKPVRPRDVATRCDVRFSWRGDTQGQLEFAGPSPFVAESVSALLGHLHAQADHYTDEELAILGACAMYMALREARFAEAGFVIGAAEKLLDSFYPVLSPGRADLLPAGHRATSRASIPDSGRPCPCHHRRGLLVCLGAARVARGLTRRCS